jgi:hypothetical protein
MHAGAKMVVALLTNVLEGIWRSRHMQRVILQMELFFFFFFWDLKL